MKSRFFRAIIFSLAACTLMFSASKVEANETPISIERFEPLYDQENNILNVAGSETLPHLDYTAGAFLHYMHAPLQLVSSQDNSLDRTIVGSQTKAELWTGIGLWNIADIGIVIPLTFSTAGDGPVVGEIDPSATGGFSVADIRIIPKVNLLHPRDAGGFGLAIAAPLFLPTGDPEKYTGEGHFRGEPRLIADYTTPFDLQVAANVGYMIRPEEKVLNITNGNSVRWSLGASSPTGVENLRALGTVFGEVSIDEIDNTSGVPIEGVLAARYALPWGLSMTGGLGTGLTRGIGAPEFRILTSIGYTPVDHDADGDGLMGSADDCPEQPEDMDNFEDDDGCPDLDNDNDGIADADDACPLEAEDIDGFKDEDGCPDLDNDEDGIADTDDTCPLEAEDIDSFEDEDGCPDLDNDKDGIPDDKDQCALIAEDMDGFEDTDGCPDPDNDGDGFCDPFVQSKGLFKQFPSCQGSDKCPNEAEVINGVEDDDGCPDEGKSVVVVTDKGIELKEEIFFDSGKDKIKNISFKTLDQVATVLSTNPQITKISIEGHTDDAGKEENNHKLSQKRAAAVLRYLEGKGISKSRMQSTGFGEENPLVPLKDEKGRKLRGRSLKKARSQNRRVEIRILEAAGK